MKCRHCQAELQLCMLDLGSAPPSNAYLSPDGLNAPEIWYPLRVLVCEDCWLVQTEDFTTADTLFSADYAYFSSYSDSWLSHCKHYVDDVVERFALDKSSHVVEVAANDGYLLQFVRALGIPCLGIEPTASTAVAARSRGITIVEEFFGTKLAQRLAVSGNAADLLIANNVLAHVPDINDFCAGAALILKPGGVATFEFPHLLQLIKQNQFDTVYHEHFSYLSLHAIQRIFGRQGLTIFDVEQLTTHGGSLRVYAQRANSGTQSESCAKNAVLTEEISAGLLTRDCYLDFQTRAHRAKDDFLSFLLKAKASGQRVVGYGAAAKGNTFLNFAGVRSDLLEVVADRNPAKQGKFLPGSRIPIVDMDTILTARPDYVVILPWNLRTEVIDQLSVVRSWGGQFVTAIPELVFE